MKSNSPIPYNFSIEEDFAYTFITDSGIKYTAYFISISQFGEHLTDTYMFSFEHVELHQSRIPDERVKATVIHILELFFQKNRNSMIYVCESLDGKEAYRKRLFERWYNEYIMNESVNIVRADIAEHGDDYDLFATLFISADNPKLSAVIKDFKMLKDMLI